VRADGEDQLALRSPLCIPTPCRSPDGIQECLSFILSSEGTVANNRQAGVEPQLNRTGKIVQVNALYRWKNSDSASPQAGHNRHARRHFFSPDAQLISSCRQH
jgi:hypothetical protein